MKRFRFRLEKVLRLAMSRERMAEAALAEARQREAEERGRLDRIAAAVARVLKASRELERKPARVTEIKKHRDFLRKLAVDREAQEQVLAEAARVTAGRLEVLLQVRKERRTLEKLKARREAEYVRESLAEEQKVLDEIGGQGARRR